MSKRFSNECIDCKYIGETGLWKVEGYEGLIHVKEFFIVKPEPGPNPLHFDLDTIDANKLIDKYKITAEKAEELILNGEPCCPKCKSLNFFAV
jgi:hypothetical protein